MTGLVLDCETTSITEPEVVEVAWLRLAAPQSLAIIERFSQRYRPSKPIEVQAMAVHHILEEDVIHCPPSATFALPADVRYILGHQIDFDWGAIGKPDVKRIDTMAMGARLWPVMGKMSLVAWLYFLKGARVREQVQSAHGAAQDVQNCHALLWAICDRLEWRLADWDEMWRYSEDCRVPERWQFGKHKGKLIEEAPRDYREWALAQDDMDAYVKVAVRRSFEIPSPKGGTV